MLKIEKRISALRGAQLFIRANRVARCGKMAFYSENVDSLTGEVQRIREHDWRCKDKFCPQCAQKRMYQHRASIFQIIEEAKLNPSHLLAVTITLKSCNLSQLHNLISLLHNGLRRILNSKFYKHYGIRGYISIIELPMIKHDDKIQAHLHGLISTSKSVLGKNYPNNEKFTDTLMSVLHLDYVPKCKISPVKSLPKYVNYITKFETDNNVFAQELNSRQITTLSQQLSYSHLYSYAGIFKQIRSEQKKRYNIARKSEQNSSDNKILLPISYHENSVNHCATTDYNNYNYKDVTLMSSWRSLPEVVACPCQADR